MKKTFFIFLLLMIAQQSLAGDKTENPGDYIKLYTASYLIQMCSTNIDTIEHYSKESKKLSDEDKKQFIACNAVVQSRVIEKPNDPESKKRYQRAKETWSYFATELSDDSLIKLTKDIINSH